MRIMTLSNEEITKTPSNEKTPYFINEANLILNYSNSYKDFIIFNF